MPKPIICPACRAPNEFDAYQCAACAASLAVGQLTSVGKGLLPAGFAWSLLPRDHAIGRLPDNDLVIPSQHLAGRHAQLTYRENTFHLVPTVAGNCLVNGQAVAAATMLQPADVITIGQDQLVYQPLAPTTAIVQVPDPAAPQLRLLLQKVQELHHGSTLEEVCAQVLDAVRHLSHTQRVYLLYFAVDAAGARRLCPLARQPAAAAPNPVNDLPAALLAHVLGGGGAIVGHETAPGRPDGQWPPGADIARVLCLPLTVPTARHGRRLVGVLYGDHERALVPLPAHGWPGLRLLQQVATALVVQAAQPDRQMAAMAALDARLQRVERELAAACGRLVEVTQQLTSGEAGDAATRWGVLRELMAAIARLQLAQAQLRPTLAERSFQSTGSPIPAPATPHSARVLRLALRLDGAPQRHDPVSSPPG